MTQSTKIIKMQNFKMCYVCLEHQQGEEKAEDFMFFSVFTH